MKTITEALEEVKRNLQKSWEEYHQTVEKTLKEVQRMLQQIPPPPLVDLPLEELEALAKPAPPPAPTPSKEGGVEAALLKQLVISLDKAKSQGEVLSNLLAGLAHVASRCALFILKEGQAVGWRGMGFSRLGGDDTRIKTLSFPIAPGSPFHTLTQEKKSFFYTPGADDILVSSMKTPKPEKILLVPMVIKDKVAAAVYADSVSGDVDFQPHLVEILTYLASLVVLMLGKRQIIPSPTLSPAEAFKELPGAPKEAIPEKEVVLELEKKPTPPPKPEIEVTPPPSETAPTFEEVKPSPPPPKPEVTPSEAPKTFEEIPAPPPPPQPEVPPPEVPKTFDEIEAKPPTHEPEAYEIEAVPPPEVEDEGRTVAFTIPEPPKPEPPPPPPKPSMPPLEERGSPEVKPPPGFEKKKPGFGFEQLKKPEGMSEEEARKYDEARRFARLLVSEIKLYNEAKVTQGRKDKNLYALLKEDIDRSFQVFKERFPEAAKKGDLWKAALVSILGGGDASTLGDHPYP